MQILTITEQTEMTLIMIVSITNYICATFLWMTSKFLFSNRGWGVAPVSGPVCQNLFFISSVKQILVSIVALSKVVSQFLNSLTTFLETKLRGVWDHISIFLCSLKKQLSFFNVIKISVTLEKGSVTHERDWRTPAKFWDILETSLWISCIFSPTTQQREMVLLAWLKICPNQL